MSEDQNRPVEDDQENPVNETDETTVGSAVGAETSELESSESETAETSGSPDEISHEEVASTETASSPEPIDGDTAQGEIEGQSLSKRHTQLVIGGIILVVILIIVGLFLPPISLADRLGMTSDEGSETEAEVAVKPEEEVSVDDGFSLMVSDEDAKVSGQTLPRDDFLSGTEDEWTKAASSLPQNATLASDLYIVEYKDDAPLGYVEVLIPEQAQPYQTLDLYYWNDEEWSFSPSQVDGAGTMLTSLENPLPKAFVLMQSGTPPSPEIGVEILPTQNLPPTVIPYLTEVMAGTLTLGPNGSLGGGVVELPMSGYNQFVRVTNTGAVVDAISLSSLLDDQAAQERNIQELVDEVSSGTYAGVNLDYQSVSATQQESFGSFVKNLAEALHQAGVELIVTLEAPFQSEDGWDTAGQDWSSIGQLADAVYIQMPVDPTVYGDNGQAEELLVWATRKVDRSKLSMLTTVNAVDAVGDSHRELGQDQALENYGELTSAANLDQVEPGESIEVSLSGTAGALEWDPESLTYKYTYEQAGQPHSVWLGSEAVLSHRNRLASRYHLRGIAIRGIGNLPDGQGYAEAIASYLGEADSPQPASAAIVWAVEDAEGGIVASSSGEDMTFTWEGSEEPGRYTIRADFAQGDSVASLGSLDIVVQAAPEPTPTPEAEVEPEIEATPETVVEGGTGAVDPGSSDAVANTDANVRNGPGLGYGIVGGLNRGEAVTLIGRDSGSSWLQIEMSDGSEGWVFAQLLSVNSTVDLGALAVVEVDPPVVASGDDGGGTSGSSAPPVIPPAAGGSFELGGQTHTLANPTLMNMAGMNWVKFQHKWGPGDSADAVAGRIQQAHGNGFKVLLSIPGANSYPSSIDFSAYVEFLRGVAALGPDAIEIWNEENIDFEWPVGQIDPASYVNNMLAPAYNAIKSANPSVMVISGAPAPTGFFGGGCGANGCDDNVYMAGVAAAGGGNYMDCIGVHFNAGATSPNASSGHPAGGSHYSWYFWPTLNMYYNAFGGSRPVCFTELGFLSGQDFGGVPSRFSWAGNTTVAQHAQWLAEAASLSANSGRVRMMIIFNIDFTHWGDDPQAGYAMLRPDGSCPSCDLLRQVMGG
jgi:hypothetical protein